MQFLSASTIFVALLGVAQYQHQWADAFVLPHQNAVASCTKSTVRLNMVIDEAMTGRLEGIRRSYQAMTERLGDPDVVNDSNLLRKVMSERSSMEETVLAFDEYCTLLEEWKGAKELFQADDSEMKEMAREEMKEIEPQMEALEEKIKVLLLPTDPNDNRNIMLEIRAGTGGSEANIFAGMYYIVLDRMDGVPKFVGACLLSCCLNDECFLLFFIIHTYHSYLIIHCKTIIMSHQATSSTSTRSFAPVRAGLLLLWIHPRETMVVIRMWFSISKATRYIPK